MKKILLLFSVVLAMLATPSASAQSETPEAETGTWSTTFGEGNSSSFVWPEGSVAQSNLTSSYDYDFSASDGNNYNHYVCPSYNTSGNHKFFTPLLRAKAGDTVSFKAKQRDTNPSLKVYLTTDRKTFDEPVATFNDLTYSWEEKNITIPEDGDYYIAFDLDNVSLCEINGLNKVNVKFDLYIRDFGSWYVGTSFQSGEQFNREVYVIPAIGVNQNDYTVEVVMGDEVVANVDSKTLSASANSASSFSTKVSKTVDSTTTLDLFWRFTYTDPNDQSKVVIESERTPIKITNEPGFAFGTTNDFTYNPSTQPTNKTSYSFGKVNSSDITVNYEIYNWGSGALNIKSVTVPEGFTTTFTAPVSVEPKGHAAFPITFAATETGTYGGDIAITYINGEGDEETFNFAVSGTMLDPAMFYCSFDSGSSLQYPAGSVRDSSINSYNSGTYSTPNYAIYSTGSSNNMFITPLLNSHKGSTISFDAKYYSSYNCSVNVYCASTREGLREGGDRTLIAELNNNGEDEATKLTYDFKTFSATIPEAGDYYIGFELVNAYIDEIYGLSLVDIDHDIELVGFSVPTTAMQNNPATATIQLRNFGFKEEAAGSYTALLSVNGIETEVTDLPEIPAMLESNATPVSISVPFLFGKVGRYPVSAKLMFGDEIIETETVEVEFTGEAASSEITAGEVIGLGDVPFLSNYKNSETVALYTPDRLGLNAGDVISTITLRGYFNVAHTSDVKVCYKWVDETEVEYASLPTTPKYDISSMTEAFNATDFNWPGGGSYSEIVDLFELDFKNDVYEQGKSLLLVFTNYADSYSNAASTEKSAWTDNCYRRQADGTKGDLTSSYGWLSVNLPVLHIALSVEPKTISGIVTDRNNVPVEGATVALTDTEGEGIEYDGTTDADGKYSINVIQSARAYNVAVSYDGMTASAENVTFEQNVVKDFMLKAKVVSIHPDASGIEAAESADIHFNMELEPGYHALALPFDIDSQLVTTLFGSGAEIYTLQSSDLKEGMLTTYFETATSVEAGEPFLVKVAETIEETIEGVTLVAEPKVNEQSEHALFSASYEATSAEGKFTFNDAGLATISGDNAPATLAETSERADGEMIPAFHATVQPRENQQINGMRFMLNHQTGVEEIMVEFAEGEIYYDLRGVRTANPAKGIYIVNGKKVIVK